MNEGCLTPVVDEGQPTEQAVQKRHPKALGQAIPEFGPEGLTEAHGRHRLFLAGHQLDLKVVHRAIIV